MRYFITILVLFSCSVCFGSLPPSALINRSNDGVVSWGYTTFTPTADQYVVENVELPAKKIVADGIRWNGNKLVPDPSVKPVYPDTPFQALEKRVAKLESVCPHP